VLPQNYAIVEYSLPYAASKAKRALDEIEASMRPDMSRRAKEGDANGVEEGGPEAGKPGARRIEQVKLLRSEFAAVRSVQSQFSRTLFVSNLPPVSPPFPSPSKASLSLHPWQASLN
jgi:hypothetical protein